MSSEYLQTAIRISGDWSSHHAGDGLIYYYNSSTEESRWEKPKEFDQISSTRSIKSVEIDTLSESSASASLNKLPSQSEKVGGHMAKVGDRFENHEHEELEALNENSVNDVDDETKRIRIENYIDMLREKNVSPFCTWEKVLTTIAFDKRFLAIPIMEERYNVFTTFVKTRREELSKERRQQVQRTKKDFRSLLDEVECRLLSTSTLESLDGHIDESNQERYNNIKKVLFHDDILSIFSEKLKIIELKSSVQSRLQQAIARDRRFDRGMSFVEAKKICTSIPEFQLFEDLYAEEYREEVFKQLTKDVKEERSQFSTERKRVRINPDEESMSYQDALAALKKLLTRTVKNCATSWSDVKHSLRKDHSFIFNQICDIIPRKDIERCYESHLQELEISLCDQFNVLLGKICSSFPVSVEWSEVRHLIKNEKLYSQCEGLGREKMFKEYARKRRKMSPS